MNPDFTQYKGYTFKEKLVNEIYAYIKEDRIKNNKTHPNYLPASLVTSLKDGEIKDMGCSIPNDIINDNFGLLMAGMFRGIVTATKDVTTFKDTGSVTRSLRIYGPTDNDLYNDSASAEVQIGEGTTGPTRTDVDVETAFTNGGIEDGPVETDEGTHIIGTSQVQVGKFIGATTGGGTVKETCLFGNYRVIGVGVKKFLLSRDLIGSVAFVAGENVSVRYFWSF